ncbi:unnamed protein product, partial [Urochloa humidicola]
KEVTSINFSISISCCFVEKGGYFCRGRKQPKLLLSDMFQLDVHIEVLESLLSKLSF